MASILRNENESGLSTSAVLGLIEKLYAAPTNPDLWSAFSIEFAHCLGADYAHLLQFTHRGEVVAGIIDDAMSELAGEYENYYAALDLRVKRALSGTHGKGVQTTELLSPEELRSCPVHQEFLSNLNLRHMLAVMTNIEPELKFVTALLRSERRGEYDEQNRRALELIHPHIECALVLERRLGALQTRRISMEAAVNQFRVGVVIVDRTGAITFANSAAERLFLADSGIASMNGYFRCNVPSETNRLLSLLSPSLGDELAPRGGSMAVNRRQGRPLVLRIYPLPPESNCFGSIGHKSIVFIHDPDQIISLDEAGLEELDLTPAEIQLATALVNGQSVQEFAAERGLSINTPRSQLKSILSKTGTSRQTELITLLLKTIAEV